MGTSLAIYEKVDNPVAFCDSMAETFAAVAGCSIQQGKAVALTCLCEGLTPHQYARTYHNIQGRTTMRADAMLAKFRTEQGGKHRVVERSENRAALELVDGEGEKYELELTWETVQQSRWPWKDWSDHDKGLKDNWATPYDRKIMLWARLVSDSIRAICPEIVAGIYTPEEISDLDVVGSQVTTAAPRRTAEEAMALHSQPEVVVSSSGELAVVEATPEPPFESATPMPPVEGGLATSSQIARLHTLRSELNPPQDKWDEALAKRNAKSVHNLSQVDAQDLIDKLEAVLRQMRPAKN